VVDGGVGLDGFVGDRRGAVVAAGGDRPVERADDAGGAEVCRASGEPMAITVSPTCRSDDLPICRTVGLVTLTLTTARSVFWSEPTSLASVRVPSMKIAVTLTPGSALAEEMTCSLVRM
jgi:hypothetical protein